MCSTFEARDAEGLLGFVCHVPCEDLASAFGAREIHREAVVPVIDPEAWDEFDLDDEGA